MGAKINPKVKVPAAALAAIGAALVALGFLTGDDTLTTAGLSALASSGIGGILGYQVPA